MRWRPLVLSSVLCGTIGFAQWQVVLPTRQGSPRVKINAEEIINNDLNHKIMRLTDGPLGAVLMPLVHRFHPDAPQVREIVPAPVISGDFNKYPNELHQILERGDLQIGDHLFYYIVGGIGYQHHGVHIGYGNIIHRPGDKPVETMSYRWFVLRGRSKGSQVYIVRYTTAFDVEGFQVRVAAALAQKVAPFRYFERNCEHFASWIVLGQEFSFQNEGFKILTRGTMLIGLVLLPALVRGLYARRGHSG